MANNNRINGSLYHFILICWSTQYIDTGIGGVLFGIGPLFTAFIAHFFIVSERINISKVLGLIIGFIGICILLNKDLIHALDSNIHYLLPQIAIIIAAMGYSIQIICVRIMPDISLLQKTSGGFLGWGNYFNYSCTFYQMGCLT